MKRLRVFAFQLQCINTICKHSQRFGISLLKIEMYIDFYRFSEVSTLRNAYTNCENNLELTSTYWNFLCRK